jgi:hypothetical protein
VSQKQGLPLRYLLEAVYQRWMSLFVSSQSGRIQARQSDAEAEIFRGT